MKEDQLIAELRVALDRAAGNYDRPGGGWPAIERRLRREPWRRAAVCGIAAVMVAAAVVAAPGLWHSLQRSFGGRPLPAQVLVGRLVVVSKEHFRQGLTAVAAGQNAVWAGGVGVIYRLDPATGRVAARITTPGTSVYSELAIGAGAVWVTAPDRSGLYRIDPSRNRVTAFIHVPGSPQGVAVANGLVWVAQVRSSGSVLRVNPGTDHVTGRPIPVGEGTKRIVAGVGALWVTNNYSGVTRIDPATGTVTASWPGVPDVAAVGAGSLWVAGTVGQSALAPYENPAVQRVDPRTGRVTATIAVPRASDIVFWHGSAWVLTVPPSSSGIVYNPEPGRSGYVVRIDPVSNRVVGTRIPVARLPYTIAAGPTGLWVVDYNATLIHLGLASNRG